MNELTYVKLVGFVALSAFCMLVVATELALLRLFDRRDRRRATLLAAVREQLGPDSLARVGISVRSSLLSRRSAVILDLTACSREEIWDAIVRLPGRLDPHARLVVRGALDGGSAAVFSLEPAPRLTPAPAPSAPTG